MNAYNHHQTQKYQRLAKAFLGLMLVYLLFHLFVSERSLPSLLSLSKQQAELEIKLVDLKTERDYLKDRVVRLRPETLDPDLIEDYSIQMLGHGGGDAIILMDDARG